MARLLTGPGFALAWRSAAFLAAAALFWRAISMSPVYPVADRPPVAAPAAPQVAAAAPAAAPPDYSAISAHPLFYPSRKPWTPPPPPPPPKQDETPPAPPLDGYRLLGVVISGAQRSALIKPPSGDKTVLLTEGQSLDGWELRQVTENKLRFASGSRTFEMSFPRPTETKR